MDIGHPIVSILSRPIWKNKIPQFDVENGDMLPDLILNNLVLTDQFNPLVRVDFEMKNSVSILAEVRTR